MGSMEHLFPSVGYDMVSTCQILTSWIYLEINIGFPVRSRKMFGGIGLFSDDVMFAIIYDAVKYLKSSPEIVKDYTEDSVQFEPPFRRGKGLSYWSIQEEILLDGERLAQWAKRSLDYAKRTKRDK